MPENLIMRVFTFVTSGLFVDIIFQELKGNVEGVQNRNGLMFFQCTAMSFMGIIATILLFPEEKPVFMREVNNKMYGVGAYFVAKLLSEIPSSIISPLLNSAVIYPYVGLSTVHSWTYPLNCKISHSYIAL